MFGHFNEITYIQKEVAIPFYCVHDILPID